MNKRWFPVIAPAVLAAAVLAAGAPAASAAAHAPTAAHAGHLNGPVHHPRIGHTSSTSTNWSGYDLTGGTYTSVSSAWTQPSVSCSSGNQYSSFWVGLDGDGSNSVEQTGTEADCNGSTAVYSAWYEMYPKLPVTFRDTVRPGDAMTGSVTSQGGGNFLLKISDTTRGWTESVSAHSSKAKLASAEVIVEAPYSGGVLPLADFGTANFASSTVDGASLGSQNPNQITMVNNSGQPKDTVSSINSSGGFSVTWVRSS